MHHETRGQHTLRWEQPIRVVLSCGSDVTVLPGRCNLYLFPKVEYLDIKGQLMDAPELEMKAIASILVRLAGSAEGVGKEGEEFAGCRDASGATPLLALLMSNSTTGHKVMPHPCHARTKTVAEFGR